jgi:hypothetical protein
MILLFVLIVVAILIFIISNGNKSNKNKTQSYTETNASINIKTNTRTEEEKLLYKTKGIKSFEIKGTYYTNLTEADAGDFFGFAKCEYNSHDQYAVGIYNENGESIGYVPKGNKRLNDSLTEWHNEKLIAWGHLQFDNYDSKWYGTVYIPIGLSEEQIKSIEETFKIIEENKELITKKELSTSEYFIILENHKKINLNLKLIKDKDNLFYYFPKTIIPSFSKKLESNKDWESLIKIEEHKDLIDNLSETYRNSTLKRIEKAKENQSK